MGADKRNRGCAAGALAAFVACVSACATSSPGYRDQKAFDDPSGAVTALAAAVERGDVAEIEAIFGSESRDVLSSGDPVEDRRQREVFVLALAEGWSLENKDSNTRELVVGHEKWPFPIPLVKDRLGWWFDTAAGKEEVLARRIGRNELAVIGALQTYMIAQRQYASEGRDGKPAGLFAQKVGSAPGRHDGLYWPAIGPDEKPSPLGEFAARAAAEGYSTEPRKDLTPYHGYFFRILARQGEHATGGAKSYVVNGSMTEGFAMIAYPAAYGNSGIMTFLVGPDGVVLESNLGEDTSRIASAIVAYDPDDAWTRL